MKNVAIAGATGAVGGEFLKLMEARDFPIKNLKLLASERSVGKKLEYCGEQITVEELTPKSFKGVDLAFFSAGKGRSKEFVHHAVDSGTVVIDNSSAFRMDPDVPLVVPEINPHMAFKHNGIIANPNCSTIQMVVALKPLHDLFVINRIDVTTFQAVSGTGKLAQDELTNQIKDQMSGATPSSQIYSKQIAFNVLPHCQDFESNGFTREEMKIVWETHRILDPNIEIAATCVRVPVLNGHSESVHIETRESLNVDAVKECLSEAKGVKLIRGEGSESYTTALEVDGTDLVHVGRVRIDLWNKNRVNLWIVADNLRKGAALNSIQIAEIHFS